MLRDFLFYLDVLWRLAVLALVTAVILGLGIAHNGIDAMFGYDPWRRWQ